MQHPILYFYLPAPLGIIGKLDEKAVIYHCVDEWEAFAGGKNELFIEAERRLIRDADLVLAANELLYERKKPYARWIHKIYHGVDYNHFAQRFQEDTPLPRDIKDIPRPILGIIGAFADWMDLGLIKFIAQRHREWSIVSIGLVESNVDVSGLFDTDNIYFLGQKSYLDLPSYYRAIGAFIIPFLLTEHIKSSAPIRLYEHLSSGKPVIATNFPVAAEIGQGLIYIGYDSEDFVKKIELALEEKDASLAEKRSVLARSNTWESRAEKISQMIEEILEEKAKKK